MADGTTSRCIIDGCDMKAKSRGWCNPHYQRWIRWGDPLIDRRRQRGPCSQPGCDEPSRGKGLCNKHYLRLRHHGDPSFATSRALSVQDRFRLYVEVHPNGCWEWTSTIDKDGYGDFWYRGKSRGAHRVAWALWRGDGSLLKAPLSIDHDCHNADTACQGGPSCLHRRCVNPAHLSTRAIVENVMLGHAPPAENLRKIVCVRGHMFAEPGQRGRARKCPPCRRADARAAARRRRERVWTGRIRGMPEACADSHPLSREAVYFYEGLRCRECLAAGIRRVIAVPPRAP